MNMNTTKLHKPCCNAGCCLQLGRRHVPAGRGGCHTAFEMSVDDVRNTLDIRGHHNVLLYGKHIPMLKTYCQLSKLAISRIDGQEI